MAGLSLLTSYKKLLGLWELENIETTIAWLQNLIMIKASSISMIYASFGT